MSHTVQDETRGVYVKGLTCRQASNEEEALNMLFEVSYMYTVHGKYTCMLYTLYMVSIHVCTCP